MIKLATKSWRKSTNAQSETIPRNYSHTLGHKHRSTVPWTSSIGEASNEQKLLLQQIRFMNQTIGHTQGRRGGRKGGNSIPNFGLSENCVKMFIMLQNFSPKMQNLGPKNPHFEKI